MQEKFTLLFFLFERTFQGMSMTQFTIEQDQEPPTDDCAEAKNIELLAISE